MPSPEGYQTSQTQCHCTNPQCVAADDQRHPCGRCVREGTDMRLIEGKDGHAIEVPFCKECIEHWTDRWERAIAGLTPEQKAILESGSY